LIAYRFENGRNDLLDAISQAKEAALHVFVIILENFIELIEEFDLSLHSCHPSKVQLEQQ